MSFGRLSLDEIRSKRLQMLSVSDSSLDQKQKKPPSSSHYSNSILPIFLGYNSGPLFSRIGEEDVVAKSENQVILRCKEAMEKETKCKKSFSSIGLQDLMDSLSYDKNHFGLAIHLLHIYPFSLIDRITLDCCKVPMPHHTAVSNIVGAVLKSITSRDTLWIGVPKLPNYKDLLVSNNQNRETSGNLSENDPLRDNRSMWGKLLHVPLLDRPYSDSATGLYVTTASHYAMKVSAMKEMFKAYKPYTLPSHDDCPLETNAVIRWKKAADVFDYSYTIENINKRTFLRVPKDLIKTINSILSRNNGRCSLMKLIQYLKNVYVTGSENIVVLLRHISPKGEWIFAHNLSPSDSLQLTLAEGCLDYDVKGNKGKYFWETMEDMESCLKMSFNDVKCIPVQKVAYESLIGFRYECGLRNRADMSGICPYRFSSRAEKIRHIKSHHAMDERQEKRMDDFFTHLQPLDSIESDQEFIERKGIAEVYDVKKLCLMPDIGAIMDEFVKVRVVNNKMVTQMNHLWEEFATSHSILLGEMERRRTTTTEGRSTSKEEDKQLEIKINEEKNRLNFCRDIVKMYRKIVLPNDVFNRYMCCLLAAIKQHVSVMTKYNAIQEGLQEADMVASDMSRVITSDWHTQLNKAGMNVASMTSDAYLQHSRRETTPSNYSSVVLGMLTSLEEHKKTSVLHTANVYKDMLEKGGCNPKELEKETTDYGMGGIGSGGGSSSKRKHKDDDEYESRGGEEEMNVCSPSLIHAAVKKHKKETGNFPSGEMLMMKNQKKDVFPLPPIIKKNQWECGNQCYDLVLPCDIQVDLRDNRELMLYILSVMRDVKQEELVSRLRYAIVNVVNVMFLLNYTGVCMLDATLQQMILTVMMKKDSSFFEKKRLLWRIFVSVVYFINSNPEGILNSLFRVRLYLPNDMGKKRQKLLPECDPFKYDSFETNNHASVELFSCGIKAFLQKIMAPTFLPKMRDPVMKDQVKLRSILSTDIGVVSHTHHRQYREGHNKYMAIQHISNLDLPSVKPMKREELELHMREMYQLKENKCPICLEKMSNRPLELFNCHYKTLEQIFKLKNGIHESRNIELSPTLYERYIQFVSKEIEGEGKGNADSAVGGHLFHRDCIRRAIQYAALDPSKSTITCPICKTDIYNSREKQIILMNITRMACELVVGIENTDICAIDTDDLINMKKCDTVYSNFTTISVDSGKGEEKCESNDMTTRCTSEAVLELTEKEGKEKCLKLIADYIRVVVDKRDEINVDDLYHQFHKPGYESVDKDAMYLLSVANV